MAVFASAVFLSRAAAFFSGSSERKKRTTIKWTYGSLGLIQWRRDELYQSELRRVLLLSLLLCDEEEIVSVLGDPDESTLSNTRRSLKQRKRRREKNQEYHQRGRVRVPSSVSNNFSPHLFFSPLVNPLFSVAFFPPRMPPSTLLPPLFSPSLSPSRSHSPELLSRDPSRPDHNPL